jgi:hypothetical protein
MALVVDGGGLVNKGGALGTGAACCCNKGPSCCFSCLLGYGLSGYGFGPAPEPDVILDYFRSMGYPDVRIDYGEDAPYYPEQGNFGLWLGSCCEYNLDNQELYYMDPWGSFYVTECLDASYFRCINNLTENECETTNPYSPYGGFGVFNPDQGCSSNPCENLLP